MDESHNYYVKWKQAVTKVYRLYDLVWMTFRGKVRTIDIEITALISYSWGWGEWIDWKGVQEYFFANSGDYITICVCQYSMNYTPKKSKYYHM